MVNGHFPYTGSIKRVQPIAHYGSKRAHSYVKFSKRSSADTGLRGRPGQSATGTIRAQNAAVLVLGLPVEFFMRSQHMKGNNLAFSCDCFFKYRSYIPAHINTTIPGKFFFQWVISESWMIGVFIK